MRRLIVLLIVVCLLVSLTACNTTGDEPTTSSEMTNPTMNTNEAAVVTEPEDTLDEELAGLVALGLCTEEDFEHLDEKIGALEFYDLLLESVRLNKIEPVKTSIERRSDAGEYPIERMEAANWLFFVVLENYFGEDLSYEPWRFGAFEYARTISKYQNRCGEALACMEHKLQNEGVEDAGWSWGVSYCAMQLDPYSMQPIMEVDEEGYFRSKDILTKEEAYRAIYRTYRSYLYSEALTLDEIEPLILTPEQQAKASQMPSASYNDLPHWRGDDLDNKCFANMAPNSSEMFTSEDFEILHEQGFNFTRLMMTHELVYDLSDGVRINSKHLDNLDDTIGYAIDNGIHICICLYDFPGFAGASMDANGFFDKDQLQAVSEAYAFLAKRYQNVPNSVLSFNLFNEPWLIGKAEEPQYVDAVHAVSNVIWKYNEDRLIFVDGIAGSQEPVDSLVGEPYVQSFHMYGPEQFVYSGWVGGTTWYRGQQWPLPYANGMLNRDKTLILQGKFSAGTRIELLLVGNSDGTLLLTADGSSAMSIDLINGETNDGKVMTLGTLETDAEELVFNWNGDIVQLESIAVIFPEEDTEGTPLDSSPWAPEEEIRHEMIYEKMTVIFCDAWCVDGEESSTLVLAEDGTYTNPGQDDLCYDQEYLRRQIEPWLEFSEKTGTEIMLQEFTSTDNISDEGGRAYLEDFSELWNRYQLSWCMCGLFLNTEQLDVEYEEYRGYLLNRGIIEALMTEKIAGDAP